MPMQRQPSFPSQVSEAYSCGSISHKVERGFFFVSSPKLSHLSA
jgi:hypothetical protein